MRVSSVGIHSLPFLSVLVLSCSGDAARTAGSAGTSAAGSAAIADAGMRAAAAGIGASGAAGRNATSSAAGSGGRGGRGGGSGASGAGAAGSVAGRGGSNAGGRSGSGTAGTAAAGSSGASGSVRSGAAILVPEKGALLGEYYGDGTVAQTEMRIGRKPAVHLTYFAWSDDWTKVAASDLAAGKIPLVNWEPDGIDFHKIVDGSLDSTIQARAAAAKALNQKFFLDFAAEMNGEEAWSGNDAKLYVDAYRHIHDAFRAAGATNVIWAFCPNVTDTNGGNKQTLDYYPGDDYVDWTGVDGYNWGEGNGFEWQSFHDVFARIYPILAAKGKPILIGEMASDETGGDKAAWIDGIIPTLQSDFPLIKAVVWFDVKKERAWQINSSPAALAAYMRFANDAFMNP